MGSTGRTRATTVSTPLRACPDRSTLSRHARRRVCRHQPATRSARPGPVPHEPCRNRSRQRIVQLNQPSPATTESHLNQRSTRQGSLLGGTAPGATEPSGTASTHVRADRYEAWVLGALTGEPHHRAAIGRAASQGTSDVACGHRSCLARLRSMQTFSQNVCWESGPERQRTLTPVSSAGATDRGSNSPPDTNTFPT